MIMRDGAVGGHQPGIFVIEIGKLGEKRDNTDILPFLSAFRPYFSPLPKRAYDMDLKVHRVPLADIECLTNTFVNVQGPIWYLHVRKGKEDIIKRCFFFFFFASIS